MPSAPLVVPPLLVIAVLLVSAVAKLRAPRDTASVFVMLELPPVLLRLKAHRLLPAGELAVAALLLLLPGHWYVVAATLTLLLFLSYVVVVARALRFPHPVVCGCFGELGLGWVTPRTLARNLLLLALAVVTWADALHGHGVLQRLQHLGGGWWWLAGVALAVLTTASVLLEGDPPEVRPTAEGGGYVALPVPYAVVDGPHGPEGLWALTATAARFLVFYNPAGEGTEELVGRVSSWQQQLTPVQVHLVGPAEWSVLQRHHPDLGDRLLGDPDGETRLRLGVNDLPAAVLLGTDRYLAGGPVAGLDDIEDLVAAASEQIRGSLSPADEASGASQSAR